MLTEQVQVRDISFYDDSTKTAHDFWQLLESTYIVTKEQAVQYIRFKLESLVYVKRGDLGQTPQIISIINTLIAQLSMHVI